MFEMPKEQDWICEHAERVVCVDIDGTITVGGPWKGEEQFSMVRPTARRALVELRRRGYIIVLHSVRKRKDLVYQWAKREGLDFDYIETKAYARYYIDDRAIGFRGSWLDVLQEVKT